MAAGRARTTAEGRRGGEATGGGLSTRRGGAEEAGDWEKGHQGFVETGEGCGA